MDEEKRGRIRGDLIRRMLDYADRVVALSEKLEADRRPRRIVDQLVGSGTSPGANAAEADEAMSNPDFIRCLGIAVKELAETRFWLRLIEKRKYVNSCQLDPLLDETQQLIRILKTIIIRSKPANQKP